MSTAKRSRRRQSEASAVAQPPASKRIKTTKSTHVPTDSGLDFLVDEERRAGKKIKAKLTNGVQNARTSRVDESQVVVAHSNRDDDDGAAHEAAEKELIELSSAVSESSEYESSDDEDGPERHGFIPALPQQHLMNGHAAEASESEDEEDDAAAGAEDERRVEVDVESEYHSQDNAQDVQEADTEMEEPSFGDILQARHPEPIDVRASFVDPTAESQAILPISGDRVLAAPSTTSLGTVLTQALKTNDKDLLESCFQTTDMPSIRATIQRLPSSLVASLLQRLAERIHKRPGRTGNLMVWVQWSLVAHGGYLAGQPEILRKVKALSQVIRIRAAGLQPLLQLKGKLDMLSAQLELRKSTQAASRGARFDDEDDEDAVIYVEGQADDWSDEEAGDYEADEDEMPSPTSQMKEPAQPRTTPKANTSNASNESEDEDEKVDELPTTNGVLQEESEDDSDQDAEANGGLIDDEAEETSDDDGGDASEDDAADSEPESDSDADSGASEDSVASSAKQVQVQVRKTLNRKR